jgi:hypothetical protein
MNADQKTFVKCQSGFALVVALSLMAFTLLLILSMSLLVQVETTNASRGLDELRAKEAARLALMMALGDLQKHAGPDQRVTARAEILGDSNVLPETKNWTGVWDTTDTTAEPHWLVSGDLSDPSSLSVNQSTLYRPASNATNPDDIVAVPYQQADTSGNRTTIYAWWISDEGSKVHIALPEKIAPLADGFFTEFASTGLSAEEQNQILKQITPRRFRAEQFFGANTAFVPSDTENIQDPAVSAEMTKANEALRRLHNASDPSVLNGIDSAEWEDAFYHATAFSKAIIANTAEGGLKIDLSNRSYNDANGNFKINDITRDFLWASSPDANGQIGFKGMKTTDVDNLLQGDPVNTTAVLMTECSLYFVVSGERKNSSTARAFLRFEGEMWSPYGFRHLFEGASGSDTPELLIEFEGLPNMTLRFYDKDSEAYTNTTILDFDLINPIFDIDFSETHKAGEIRKIAGDWPINDSSNKSKFYYTSNWDWVVNDPSYNSSHRAVSYPDGDSINYQAASSEVTILIKNRDGDILQRIENFPVGAISTDFSYYESSPSSLSQTSAPIAFQFRMRDDLPELEDWFATKDPRSITIDFSNQDVLDLYDINDVDGDKKSDVDLPLFNAFSSLDFFHGQQNNNFYRLFDLPAAPPTSVGVFQHLQFKDTAPFAVGNKWGGGLNEVFDRYFISGIPRDTTGSFWTAEDAELPGSLPNPFLSIPDPGSVSVADLLREDSAQHLFQDGAFNFNSTSIEAWQAVLLSNSIYDWTWILNRGTSSETSEARLNLESAFFRLPFSGHLRSESFTKWEFPFELYEDELSSADDYPYLDASEKELIFRDPQAVNPIKDWRPAAALGHRELDTDASRALAAKIVDKLKERGRPFGSFKELANTGLLQEAIDETPINAVDPSTLYIDATSDQRIPRNASAFLSQADLLSALSPGMSARSDTFRIRSYASIQSSLSQKSVAHAYCEAIVQRIPERVDEDRSRIMENAQGYGRRFKIINIQWLDASQL